VNTDLLLKNIDSIAKNEDGILELRQAILKMAIDGIFSKNNGLYWESKKLGECVRVWNGRAYGRKELLSSGTPIIRIQNLNGGSNWYYSNLTLEPEKYCEKGDLLFAWSGTFGPYIWEGEKSIYHYHIWKLDLFEIADKKFFFYLLKKLTAEIKAEAHGLMLPHMTKSGIEAWPIKLPPIEEQKRIVAKVDQLMALCDELEAKQEKQTHTRRQLNDVSLNAIISAASPKEFEMHWQKISDNFDLLYDDFENLKAFRKVIRELAVQGKLGTNNPSEGPDETVKDSSRTGFYPFSNNWGWGLFADVAEIQTDLVKPQDFLKLPHVAPDNIEKGTGKLLSYRTVEEDGVKSANQHFFPGQILYSKIRPNLSKLVIVDFEGLCSADMYPLKANIDKKYLQIFMLTKYFLRQVTKLDNRLAMPKVNKEELSSTIVAVPPREEQKRIVFKVDQLMALCDELEKKLTSKSAHLEKLTESLLRV
jgi:type I restriction enzyme S subunit